LGVHQLHLMPVHGTNLPGINALGVVNDGHLSCKII